MKKAILESIYRLKVCAWAYSWDTDRLKLEIRSAIAALHWKEFCEIKEAEDRFMENIVLEIKNKTCYEELILPREQPKNRSYGNKYIKRKFR